MATTCTIRDTADKILATGSLLSQSKTGCQIVVDAFVSQTIQPAVQQPVVLHLINSTYGIRVYTAVTARLSGNVLSFTHMQQMKTIQRRSDVKIKMTATLTIHPMIQQVVEGKKVSLCNVDSQTQITLRDISTGGMGFICAEKLDPELVYSVSLPFMQDAIVLLFVVLRCVPHPGDKYFHGCQFQKMSPPTEHALRSFIYRRGIFQNTAQN